MDVTYVRVSWNVDGDFKKIMFYISVYAILEIDAISLCR